MSVDGGHHGGLADAARGAWLATEGYRVLRFRSSGIMGGIQGAVARIAGEAQR